MLSGVEMVGATSDVRSAKTALLRFEGGGAFPVCWVNSAFFLAIAAAASGNIALIVDESRPELRLAPGEGGGRPRELRELSTFSFDIASFKRLDMASVEREERKPLAGAEGTGLAGPLTLFAKISRGQKSRHGMTF